jgi:hypothetical protein
VHSHGWKRFEEVLENEDPDLLNLDRDETAGICNGTDPG